MSIEFKPNNEIKNPTENIHDEFMQSFDSENIVKNFQSPEVLKNNFYNYVYSNIKFKNNLSYLVYGKDPYEEKDWKEGKKFDFCLTGDVSDWRKYYASIILTEEVENKGVFEMHHRQVKKESKDKLGISGSDFLQKTEEYLNILKENNLIEIKKIQSKVSQFSVASWLIKNNFTFNKDSKNSIQKCFKNNDGNLLLDEKGRPILNDEYELIVMEDRHVISITSSAVFPSKDEYIIRKDFFTDIKYKKLRDKYYKDGTGDNFNKKILIYDGGRRGGNVVNDLVEAGLMPRFILEKEIK